LLLLAAAACTVEKAPGSADSATPRADKTPAADSTAPAPTTPPASGGFTVSADAAGPIRIGMSITELKAAAGDLTPPPNATTECTYVRPASAPPGVAAMLAKGVVARIDVDSAGVATREGVAVGDTATKVNEAYAGRVAATPHKYVPGGQYLTVKPGAPQDSLRIVFESEGGRITRYRVGRIPQVEWVERCG
jgi:hypothetical protein